MLILIIFCQDIFINTFNNIPFHFALLLTQMKTLHCFTFEFYWKKNSSLPFEYRIFIYVKSYLFVWSILRKTQLSPSSQWHLLVVKKRFLAVRELVYLKEFICSIFQYVFKGKVNLEFLLTIKEHKY